MQHTNIIESNAQINLDYKDHNISRKNLSENSIRISSENTLIKETIALKYYFVLNRNNRIINVATDKKNQMWVIDKETNKTTSETINTEDVKVFKSWNDAKNFIDETFAREGQVYFGFEVDFDDNPLITKVTFTDGKFINEQGKRENFLEVIFKTKEECEAYRDAPLF